MLRKILTVVCIASIGTCAGVGRGEPIVDMKGVNQAQYEADLAECKQYVAQVDAGGKVAGGAAAGAAVGGIMGAIFGNGGTAARGAGAGAVAGGARGAGSAIQERHQVLRNCLLNRGYRVLN